MPLTQSVQFLVLSNNECLNLCRRIQRDHAAHMSPNTSCGVAEFLQKPDSSIKLDTFEMSSVFLCRVFIGAITSVPRSRNHNHG